MRVLRALLTATVPIGLALVAFLNANTVSALVDGTISGTLVMPSIPAAAHAAAPIAEGRPTASAILDRNPFDHVTGSLRPREDGPEAPPVREDDPRSAPLCEGVRPLVLVGGDDQRLAFASLDYGGKRLLRKQGGEVGDAVVAYVGRDRVWLEGKTGLCQAPLFGRAGAPPPPPPKPEGVPQQSALEIGIGKQIVKTGPNEYAIDRSAVDRILEAQQELMKHRIVAEKEGVKVLGIKPGSVLASLGIENGDRLETINGFELTSPEKMLEAYARLRGGADRLQVRLTRNGKPMNLDYSIR